MLFYAGLGTLTLWVLLKVTGVINTPVWLEFGVPVISLVIALFALYHDLLISISNIAVSVAKIGVKMEVIEKEVNY